LAPLTATLLLLMLAARPPTGERSYRILVDGRDDGAASLSIQARADGSFDYHWRSQIGVSRAPCLWSEEQRSGNYTVAAGRALPDELALSLLPTDANGEVSASVNGQRLHAVMARDGLPNRVDLLDLGLSYVAAPPGTIAWDRCGAGALDRGPELIGVDSLADPRQVQRATFERLPPPPESAGAQSGWRSATAVPDATLPDIAGRLVQQAYQRAPGRDCKVVAFELAHALERAGFRAHVAAGWIVVRGTLWPHAWTELEQAWGLGAIDATTGSGWADAARIRLGTLDSAEAAAKTGERLLRERHSRIRLVDYLLSP
jgi:hypothetical protein